MNEGVQREGGSGLGIVLGALAALSVLFGVLAYWRYAGSERYVREGITEMSRVGADLEAEACVIAVLDWAHDCDVRGTNAAVCEQAVKIWMFHCLAAQDRTEACHPYEKGRESGAWVYDVCLERGYVCPSKRECLCAEAYRALESFCIEGQERVQL